MPGSRERTTRREFFRFKNPGESYGVVRTVLGDGRFRVQIHAQVGVGVGIEGRQIDEDSVVTRVDEELVVARIRGNMRDRVIITVGDVVLVDESFIVKKYTPEEVQMLRDEGHF